MHSNALLTIEELRSAIDRLRDSIGAEYHPLHVQLENARVLISRFIQEHYEGKGGIDWDRVIPVTSENLFPYDSLPVPGSNISEMLRKVAVVKLNGGLGTSMGCSGPKNAIEVRNGKTFFDCFVDHLENLNAQYDSNIPLILMNSFNTDEITRAHFVPYQNRHLRVFHVVQQQFPRIDAMSFLPIAETANPDAMNGQDWYPPGHGDVYDVLLQSEVMDVLRAEGREILFISNGDNLGASLDVSILSWLLTHPSVQFCTEVVQKTLRDVKGGTIIEYNGHLKLLEVAEVPPEHMQEFASIDKFKVFNTNSLWVRLDALRPHIEMDIIINRKKVNGRDVIQLEQAMAAAISSFNSSVAIEVPRTRYAPVKKCNDLLTIMSDLYSLENGVLRPSPSVDPAQMPEIILNNPEYNQVEKFLNSFEEGIPSLKDLNVLELNGDFRFGPNVVLKGNVRIVCDDACKVYIPEGSVLEDVDVYVNDDGSLRFERRL